MANTCFLQVLKVRSPKSVSAACRGVAFLASTRFLVVVVSSYPWLAAPSLQFLF